MKTYSEYGKRWDKMFVSSSLISFASTCFIGIVHHLFVLNWSFLIYSCFLKYFKTTILVGSTSNIIIGIVTSKNVNLTCFRIRGLKNMDARYMPNNVTVTSSQAFNQLHRHDGQKNMMECPDGWCTWYPWVQAQTAAQMIRRSRASRHWWSAPRCVQLKPCAEDSSVFWRRASSRTHTDTAPSA